MTTAFQFQDDFSLGPAAEFMRTMSQLNHVLERASRRMEAACGVTAQQRMIIRCVGKYPGLTAGQLAVHFHLDPGTVTAAIDRLAQKGLVERRRTERDRRRVILGLTRAGRKIDAAVVGPTERALQEVLGSMPSDDVTCTQRVLASLANGIGKVLLEDPKSREA